MSVSTSRLSYVDCFDLMDRALNDELGVRTRFETEAKARYYRMRLQAARVIDRNDNAKLFPLGEPMHGRSIYDTIVARVKGPDDDGFFWLYLEKWEKNIQGPIENLSDLEESTE